MNYMVHNSKYIFLSLIVHYPPVTDYTSDKNLIIHCEYRDIQFSYYLQ